jgi:hypothetical protein
MLGTNKRLILHSRPGLRRLLHARHAKQTASWLAAEHLRLSPVHGLFLYGSPALASMWAAGETGGPAAARLARVLFNRHDPSEPLRATRNKSLPATHLTPALQGACVGLALSGASEDTVRARLIELGVDAIARRSKVSIARFERLVGLLAEASSSACTMSCDGGGGSVQLCGVDVMLAYLWATARSKECLLAFLLAVQPHLRSRLFAPDLAPESDAGRAALVAEDFGEEVEFMLGGGSRAVAPEKAALGALQEGTELPHDALERLAFTLVARAGCAPEVPQRACLASTSFT